MVVDKRFMFIGLALLIVALVGCTLPIGEQSILAGSKLELVNGQTFWRIDYVGVGQSDNLVFDKNIQDCIGTTCYETNKRTEIAIRQLNATLLAVRHNLISDPVPTAYDEYVLKSSPSVFGNPVCDDALAGNTKIVPWYFDAPSVVTTYSVEVLVDGARVDYKTFTNGVPGSAPVDEMELAGGKVKISNIRQFTDKITYPSLSDYVYLQDLLADRPQCGDNLYTCYPQYQLGKSRASFESNVLNTCGGSNPFNGQFFVKKRWSCTTTNCNQLLRSQVLPNLNNPAGWYSSVSVPFKGWVNYNGKPYGAWDLKNAGYATADEIIVTVSTDLGSFKVNPQVPTPEIGTPVCPQNLRQGEYGAATVSVKNTGQDGQITTYSQMNSGGAQVTNPVNPQQFTAGETKQITSSILSLGSGNAQFAVRACNNVDYPGQTVCTAWKTCDFTMVASTEKCIDGTTVGNCVPGNKPYFCNAMKQLVQDSPVCGCPAGQNPQADKTCKALPPDCPDGTTLQPDGTCKAGTGGFDMRIVAIGGAVVLLAYIIFGRRK